MPIVDGMMATKHIREFEAGSDTPSSEKAKSYGRIPIFAVSASLIEKDAQMYIDAGFDGYLMKPIDFQRVNLLLRGLDREEARKEVTYQPGANWELGGWLPRDGIRA